MAIIVETGLIVSGANSYVSEAELTTYATDRGETLSGGAEALLLKSMDYLESLVFIGLKRTQDQPLQWPRTQVYIDGFIVDSETIPTELKNAQMAVAIAIDGGYDPLAPVDRSVKREKVDLLEVEYADNAAPYGYSRTINHLLRKLVSSSGPGSTQFECIR